MSNLRATSGVVDSRSLRETALLAATSLVAFALGLIRTKVLALAWGPAGVGALGLMQAAMGAATLVAGLGIDGVVPRELAKAQPADEETSGVLLAAATRGSALVAALGSVCGFGVLWLLRGELGLGGTAAVAVLAVGVFASVWSMNLRAVLAGVGAVARVGAVGVVATALTAGIAIALSLLPSRSEYWALAVASVPASQLLVAAVLVARTVRVPSVPWRRAIGAAFSLARQSNLLAVAGVVVVVSQVAVRWVVQDQMVPSAFGAFQASMTLAAVSVSVLAGSVGPSVLPRLSAVAGEPVAMSAVMEEQASAYVLLFAPVALGLIAVPEWVVRILFSAEFLPAAGQLRWQMIGELLRLPCWVMATVLVVKGRSRAFLFLEVVSMAVSVTALFFAARFGGHETLGVAITLVSASYFLLLWFLVTRDGVTWSNSFLVRLFFVLIASSLGAAWARSSVTGQVFVLVLCAFAGLMALRQLRSLRSRR